MQDCAACNSQEQESLQSQWYGKHPKMQPKPLLHTSYDLRRKLRNTADISGPRKSAGDCGGFLSWSGPVRSVAFVVAAARSRWALNPKP